MLSPKHLCFVIVACALSGLAYAQTRTVNLNIGYKIVNFTGKKKIAIAANHKIPGPVLHFKQGDHVIINVYNHLKTGTSIHWHGIILPWQMDGVEGITQKPIPPNGVFHYRFTLRQSGTYWYHAHSGVQEQEGLYGAFIVDPKSPPKYHYTKDFPIVLSDWSNIPANRIMAKLKKDGEYFSPRFPLQPSLAKFIRDYRHANPPQRKKLLHDYKMMQQMRMSIYDLSDVAYDAFLLNGHANNHPWIRKVKVGDTVRLRFIGASASTIFHVKVPGSKLKLVQVDGNNVKPSKIDSFTIAPGETYDVLVHIKQNRPYIIYAESSDTIGAALGALITQSNQKVAFSKVKPFPEPKPIIMMHGNHHKQHHKMHYQLTQGTKYQKLKAAVKTNNPNKPIAKTIHMQLSGWMGRYVWLINGKTEQDAKPIILHENKRYRLIFTNTSMMQHPMHIHGHWFILRNGHGAYDPLLHTILVPPGATVVADIDTDASGQWFFHCHHLYHMMSGMSRVFQYASIIDLAKGKGKPQRRIGKSPYKNRPIVRVDLTRPLDKKLILHPHGHHGNVYFANHISLSEDPFHNVQKLTFNGLYGSDFHKLQLHAMEAELNKGKLENADLDIFYWHPISQFWAIKGGANYFLKPGTTPYWQPGIGIEGLFPYFIEIDARLYYHNSSMKADIELSRDTQITNNFLIGTGIRAILATKTVTRNEIGSGLNELRFYVKPYYRVAPGIDIFFEYEHEHSFGAYRSILKSEGEAAHENTTSFGIDLLI